MKIQIVTPSKNICEDEAEMLYAQGPKGEFGILPGHAYYVTPLEAGPLYYVKNGKNHTFFLSGGFLVANQDQVRVLADAAERAENLDKAALQSQVAVLEKRLSVESLDAGVFAQTLSELRAAQGRVAAALLRS